MWRINAVMCSMMLNSKLDPFIFLNIYILFQNVIIIQDEMKELTEGVYKEQLLE